MEDVAAVALLAPRVLFFTLALAVTVHYFWLSHQGRWPLDVPAQNQTMGDIKTRRPNRPRVRRESHA